MNAGLTSGRPRVAFSRAPLLAVLLVTVGPMEVPTVTSAARSRALARLGRYASFSWGALALLTVMGAVIRFATLAHQSLWTDEAVTATLVRKPFEPMLQTIPHTESTPPSRRHHRLHRQVLRGHESRFAQHLRRHSGTLAQAKAGMLVAGGAACESRMSARAKPHEWGVSAVPSPV
jgi:hypothetical protein